MPTYTAAHENDIDVCRAVGERMHTKHRSILILDDPHIFKAVSGELDVLLAGRMHAAIMAIGAGTPVIGLAYNQKFSGVFRLLDMSANCLPLDRFVDGGDARVLADKLCAAMTTSANGNSSVSELAERTRYFIRTLTDKPDA
jgi:polysaccharide pyruvyl transferase WcaK-like protein